MNPSGGLLRNSSTSITLMVMLCDSFLICPAISSSNGGQIKTEPLLKTNVQAVLIVSDLLRIPLDSPQAAEPQEHTSHRSIGLSDVVIVIQSQRNSFHARRGGQRKVEILQQAAELGQHVTPSLRVA
ncbi:Beta-1,3-glucosyltransferase [Liparis tanakae]|uniref:Beta-1,3-glucosyltransferase n=1 Tax=Liparis tanakae TaxID=230148 RepID=A0A4Z2GN97_9TELE|nr:Beta-1,3-glucosyltransferase [Liparis tanakae]